MFILHESRIRLLVPVIAWTGYPASTDPQTAPRPD
jgi:hypothetical protein